MEYETYRAATLGELKVRIDEAISKLQKEDPSISPYDVAIYNMESNSDAITFVLDPVEMVANF